MATEYILGARASCSDGLCGEVTRAILHPVARTVTHLAIEPKHRAADGRLVPVDLIDAASGEITLRCTIAEFDRLDPSEEIDLAEGINYGGGYGESGAVQGYGGVGAMGVGASVSGMGIGMDLGHNTPVVASEVVPEGESDVVRNEAVHAVDGEIGQVKGFVVDPADQRLTYVLLREGHLWGRKEVAIPASAVASVENGIRLNLTKKQVEDLPAR